MRDKDTFSKSDPICILKGKNRQGFEVEFGRTEQIQNNLNPRFKSFVSLKVTGESLSELVCLRFTTPIAIEYFFEDKQDLEFLVYDIDDPRASLDKQDFLGSFKVIYL